MRFFYLFIYFYAGLCVAAHAQTIQELATFAEGWTGEIVATVPQSYAGWDVEIGDADNDGQNEILTTGCPDSRLYLFKKVNSEWHARLLAENLAEHKPGMGLAVRVADLNADGRNEVIVGTGQEGDGTAFFYVFQTDGLSITKRLVSRPEQENQSAFTHSFGIHDLDGDGLQEVISAYCGGGEIIRYDVDAELTAITAKKLYTVSGSGEDSVIADVDNDGQVEYLTANAFRAGASKIEIFEFGPQGELITPPRLAVEGYGGQGCFYVSFVVGDFDNDGKNDLVAGWKRDQAVNRATLVAYRVAEQAEPVCLLENETEDLDMAYFEKMMAIADADNDGQNELVISTRGDNASENITSAHMGSVFLYKATGPGAVQRTKLIDFNPAHAESSWLAVGDADNDGQNEIILATGKGDRTQPGTSHVLLIEKDHNKE